MILDYVQDSNENLVLTSVETVEGDLNEVDFPALTFCHDQPHVHDSWTLPETILNFFETDCNNEVSGECSKTGMNRLMTKFKPFFEDLFDVFMDSPTTPTFTQGYKKHFCKLGMKVTLAIRNKTSIEDLTNNIKTSLLTSDLNVLNNELDSLEVDGDCHVSEVEGNVWTFLSKLKYWNRMVPKSLGTFLRTFQGYGNLGKALNDDIIGFLDCEKLSPVKYFHKIMIQLGRSLDFNVSLLDLPKLYNLQIPTTEASTPKFFYCDFEKENDLDPGVLTPTVQGFSECGQLWESYFTDGSDQIENNPYLVLNSTEQLCSSKLSEAIGGKLKDALRIMKFSYHIEDNKDITNLYDIISNSDLGYSMKPFSSIRLQGSWPDWQPKPFVFHDFVTGKFDSSSFEIKTNGFLPTITDNGLCTTWNTFTTDEIFKKEVIENHLKIFEGAKQPLDKATIRKISFILDRRSDYSFPMKLNQIQSFFSISISGPDQYYNFNLNNVQINRGSKVLIKVKPVGLKSNEDLRGLSLTERKCRFGDEVPDEMILFKNYSRQSCMFDCMFRFSLKECLCIPWSMPRPKSFDLDICTAYGNECFYSKMKNITYLGQQCQCLPGCNHVQYESHVEVSNPLSKNEATQYCSSYSDALYHYNIKKNPVYLIELMNTSYSGVDYCIHELMTNMAKVTIEIDGFSYLSRVQSLRYSISDKIGTIGGLLGLFTGFSFLALVEIFYWMIVTIKDVFGSP